MSDTRSHDDQDGRKTGFGDDLLMAIRFFSRLPTGSTPHEIPSLARIAIALPFASLVIGAIPAAVLYLSVASGISPLFSAVLAAAIFAIVTGAMSEDAVADSWDGLFGGTTPERRLDILKDSRHGTYGVLALIFVVGMKIAALSALATHSAIAAAAVWLAATTLARSGGLYVAIALPPARAMGAAASAGQLSRNAFGLGLVFAGVIGFVLGAPSAGLPGLLVALILGAVITLVWTRLCDRLVGGQTGDLIGALQAVLEIALLGVFMRFVTG